MLFVALFGCPGCQYCNRTELSKGEAQVLTTVKGKQKHYGVYVKRLSFSGFPLLASFGGIGTSEGGSIGCCCGLCSAADRCLLSM